MYEWRRFDFGELTVPTNQPGIRILVAAKGAAS